MDSDHPTGSLQPPLKALLAILFVLITAAGALALTIDAPASIDEGEALTVTATGDGTITLTRDGVAVATGAGIAIDTRITDSTSAGTYTYVATSDAPAEVPATTTVIVNDVPFTLTLLAPQTTDLNTSDVLVRVRPSWQPDFCYLTTASQSHMMAQDGETYRKAVTLGDGIHQITAKCSLAGALASANTTLTVDTLPPTITAVNPSTLPMGAAMTLQVDTDEIALCRYGPSDLPYAQLPSAMSATYTTRNIATVTAQAVDTYYVRCMDVYGNTGTTARSIRVSSGMIPTATIDLPDANEPLIAGTYALTLITSAPLRETPSLTATLQESGKTQTIPLTGDGREWRGYLIIGENTLDTVISFTFRGTTDAGVEGTQITAGGIVTVDARPPAPVDALAGTLTPEGIRLEWFAAAPERDQVYRIYRASHEGVAYTDFVTATQAMSYLDTEPPAAPYLYYRVAAVDAAGNIGPLSSELQVGAVPEATMDAGTKARFDEAVTALRGAMIDANETITMLETEGNPARRAIIDAMRMLDTSRAERTELEGMLAALETMPSTDLSLDARIAEAVQRASIARTRLAMRIDPDTDADRTQLVDAQEIERLLPYAMTGTTPTASERDTYLTQALRLQDSITVRIDAMSFTIWDRTGTPHDYTVVRKEVMLQTPANDISIIESIPKSVAASARDIAFSPTPEILEDDPVVRYSFPVLSQASYSYVLARKVPFDELLRTRTIAYPSRSVPQGNALTGMVASDDGAAAPPVLDIILLIAGGIILAALIAYYVSLSVEQRPSRPLPPAVTQPRRIVQTIMPRMPSPALRTPTRAHATHALPDARALLATAETSIDEVSYHHALGAYRAALALLHEDAGLAAELDSSTKRIYAKLLLAKRIDDARRAAEREDAPHLKRSLEDIRMLAHELGEGDIPLLAHAKRSYAQLVRALNHVEIQRASRY